MGGEDQVTRYRTIWISDIHLGTRGCKAENLLDFLRYTDSEFLYLVGDIVDGWRLRKSWYCPQTHNDVVQKLLRKARKGTKVVYVPGNHDEVLRDYTELVFGGVTLLNEAYHTTLDGRRLWITHGDQFDGVIRYARWLAALGDWAYNFVIQINYWFNQIRHLLGFNYWSLSRFLKLRVKNAVSAEARRRGADGVVCGHIHHAQIKEIDGILYCNDGDWVESCTALVEHRNGQLEIVDWADVRQLSMLVR